MKKNTSKKTQTATKRTVAKVSTKSQVRNRNIDCRHECFNPWSLSIYVYWFLILFFIGATFYILGRSHNALNTVPGQTLTEETLMVGQDYYENGKSKLLSGQLPDAITELTTAIDANPDFVDAYILRGEAYMQSGDYTNAMVDFDTAINKDVESAIAYYDRCLLFTRLENYDAALNDINRVMALVAMNQNSILQERDLYAKRGQLNLWSKNWEGAIADYTNSLARPEGSVNPRVYAERAEAYTALGMYQQAIEDYSTAVRVIAEQIQIVSSTSEREHLSSDAMSYFEKSAALNIQLGNIGPAQTDLESALSIARALNDESSVERLNSLLNGLNNNLNADVLVTEDTTVANVEPGLNQ